MAENRVEPGGNIIDIKHVSKWFGDKQVLDDVSLYIRKGEFVTILGPSGCGKTTLLRILAGFETASEGEILLEGADITQTPPHQRPMNTVFQRYALFPHLNVYDNIAFGLKLKKTKANIIENKVRRALKMVGMTDYEHRDVNSLSGGQQQRVAIAPLFPNPVIDKIAIFDPFAFINRLFRHCVPRNDVATISWSPLQLHVLRRSLRNRSRSGTY